MVISGANNLLNNKSKVDKLNVFPVPDGDTGTNMSLTLSAAAKEISKFQTTYIGDVAFTLANASLRGARGNSGVILSQLCRGISKHLKGKSFANAKDFSLALKAGVDTAYRAVMKPTEGTILTVARESADAAVLESEKTKDITKIFKEIITTAKTSLDNTPNLLPVLKQAGVVDAGGMGLLYILEGANKALLGKFVNPIEQEQIIEKQDFTDIETADIKYAYCTEFIIDKKSEIVDVLRFSDIIDSIGDSKLVIDDESIVKVHIHTNNPGFVIEEAIKLGSLSSIKIDNMKLQHQNIITMDNDNKNKIQPKKQYGFVVVAAGAGISEIYKDLGADEIIEGGQSMNPSTESILEAIEKVNADNIFVLPNNKNIILAAQQAAELTEKNIIVLPSKSIPQGISAMLAFDNSFDLETNKSEMINAIPTVKTGQVTFAVRNTSVGDKVIKEGDIIGINDNGIEVVGSDAQDVCKQLIENMISKEDSIISVFYGHKTDESSAKAIEASLKESYPDIDILLKHGGQPLYYYIVSVE